MLSVEFNTRLCYIEMEGGETMAFLNVLFASESVYKKWCDMPKSGFDSVNSDINLDQIAEHILKNRPDFPAQYLLYPCGDRASAEMRIEALRELYEKENICEELGEITKTLTQLKKCKENEYDSGCDEQKQMYFLKTAEVYIECVQRIGTISSALENSAFKRLHLDLEAIQNAAAFQSMVLDVKRLSETFAEILNLSLAVDYSHKTITVSEHIQNSLYEELKALCADMLGITIYNTFSAVNSNPLSFLESDIIQVLKQRHPAAFQELADFYERYGGINVYDIANLKTQFLFYTEYIEFIKKSEAAGMRFTLPIFTNSEFDASGLYDLSLALKTPNVVPNDIQFQKGSLFVLSGPNQGGKTTFIRGLGQCVLLAMNGCFVPAENCKTPYFDSLMTHFNRRETLGHGRLEEELERIEKMLPLLTENSFVLFNECFMSTRRVDGVKLSLNLLNKLFEIGCCGGFVTHYYEIPEHDLRLISLVAGISSDGQEDKRTYKITRRPPSGTAYARSIALKCGVTFDQLKELIQNTSERSMEQ